MWAQSASDNPVVVGVASYPEPKDTVRYVHAQCAIRDADASRNEVTDFLEVKRGMCRILFEQSEILSGEFLNMLWQRGEAVPEVGRGVMLQSSVDLPLL